jgi:coenzyme F420 hydrogenase subunit beta
VVVLFPTDEDLPTLKGGCVVCQLCYYSCPRIELPLDHIEQAIFGRHRNPAESAGIILNAYSARSKLPEAAGQFQDGGVATTLLIHALEIGLVKNVAAVGIDPARPWKPMPVLATSKAEVVKCAGSKYFPSASVMALADAAIGYPSAKSAFIGLPCQIQALRRMATSFMGAQRLASQVALAISLFCYKSYNYEKLVSKFIRQARGIDLSKITKMDCKENRFRLYARDEVCMDVSLKELEEYTVPGCYKCQDFTGELADISIGAAGSPIGWCTLLIRTEIGQKLFESACKTGLLEWKPLSEVKPGLKRVERLSEEKRRERQAPYIKHSE